VVLSPSQALRGREIPPGRENKQNISNTNEDYKIIWAKKKRKENTKKILYIKDVFHNFGGGQITCTQKGVNTSGVLDFSHIFFLFVLFLITGRLWVGWPFFHCGRLNPWRLPVIFVLSSDFSFVISFFRSQSI
jgi:hypothetical protein